MFCSERSKTRTQNRPSAAQSRAHFCTTRLHIQIRALSKPPSIASFQQAKKSWLIKTQVFLACEVRDQKSNGTGTTLVTCSDISSISATKRQMLAPVFSTGMVLSACSWFAEHPGRHAAAVLHDGGLNWIDQLGVEVAGEGEQHWLIDEEPRGVAYPV